MKQCVFWMNLQVRGKFIWPHHFSVPTTLHEIDHDVASGWRSVSLWLLEALISAGHVLAGKWRACPESSCDPPLVSFKRTPKPRDEDGDAFSNRVCHTQLAIQQFRLAAAVTVPASPYAHQNLRYYI